MPQIHYLNVKNGDCSFIKHIDGRVTVIDVNNAFLPDKKGKVEAHKLAHAEESKSAIHHDQKKYPVNPIDYFKAHNVSSVFRFILTHPDMDHMDGIEDFFKTFKPTNFWDTANTKSVVDFSKGRFQESDWEFYKNLRAGKISPPKRLTMYAGEKGKYFNQNEKGEAGGNGLDILSPTLELVNLVNETEEWNDCSYVILYRTGNRKILFCGDADSATWEHLIKNHQKDIKDVDLLIAPHHGRKSSCSYDFLKVVNPKVTFFGNADKASHLAHEMFNNLKLYKITNNEGNCLIANINGGKLDIYVTNKEFAVEENKSTFYNKEVKGYFVKSI